MARKLSPKSQAAVDEFYAAGHTLPTCINVGCNSEVAWRERKYWSFKSECSPCANARKQNKWEWVNDIRVIRSGATKSFVNDVIIHKGISCANHDGRLSFTCLVPKGSWDLSYQMSLDLEHVDGDHNNNVPANVITICKLCHNKSSVLQGHTNSHRASGRKIE